MKITDVAGGVVVNEDGKILVVSQGDSWSLPKGHVDPNETHEQAAIREIEEESGITKLELLEKLGVYRRYRIGKNGQGEDKTELKSITIYLFKTTEMDLKPLDPRNPEARWVSIHNVEKLLTHPKDKKFFSEIKPKIHTFR